jgi:NAD(P)-dependent dehydrogenase (short-subunit alcohol dehydrogenase family)
MLADIDHAAGLDLASELNAQGSGACDSVRCDVSRPIEIDNAVVATVNRFGRLDCLINNAAVHPPFKSIDDFSVEEFQELLQVNVISYFAASKAALPHLRRTRGSIVNIGSLTGVMGDHWSTTYAATKGAISSLTKALAIDEAKHQVRVNAILPGNIMTESRERLEAKMNARQAFHDYVESWQWLGRSGTPDEVGQACLFLAGQGASFITGCELIVSGGSELGFGPKGPMPDF